MMHAYDRDYLYHAQKNFGHMLDFAVNTCEIDIDEYFQMFFASNVCVQFEDGNPAYIVGKTGCELVRLVVSEVKGEEIDEADVKYMDKKIREHLQRGKGLSVRRILHSSFLCSYPERKYLRVL